MELKKTRELSAGTKFLAVITCAIMTGFMWRVRGEHGWGSMWGMFAVGVMLTLFIFALFGNRRKMSYEAIPAAVILLGITNGGWGTLNSQMGGYLGSGVDAAATSLPASVEISPFSGLGIMLLLGFGWMPLYSLFTGSLFSKREYKIKHYIILIAVFYAVTYLFKFTVSHYILPFINPQAVEMVTKGLAEKGIELSPMMAYIKNFGSASWAKVIPFCRNYFTSIDVISAAAGALISSFAALVILKDKVAFFISLAMNTVMALSITLADAFLIIDSDAGFLARINAPAFIYNNGWPLWEYFTGFLMGFGVMLILVCLPKSISEGESFAEYEPVFKKRGIHFAYSAVLTLMFTFGLTLARPAGMRFADWLLEKGVISDEDTVSIIITVIICAIALIPAFIVSKKNIIARELNIPFAMRTEDFCMKAIPAYFVMTAFVYFFIGDTSSLNFLEFRAAKSLSMLLETLKGGGLIISGLMVISFVLFFAFYFIIRKKAVSKK